MLWSQNPARKQSDNNLKVASFQSPCSPGTFHGEHPLASNYRPYAFKSSGVLSKNSIGRLNGKYSVAFPVPRKNGGLTRNLRNQKAICPYRCLTPLSWLHERSKKAWLLHTNQSGSVNAGRKKKQGKKETKPNLVEIQPKSRQCRLPTNSKRTANRSCHPKMLFGASNARWFFPKKPWCFLKNCFWVYCCAQKTFFPFLTLL